jgi:hypothetical protein
MQGEAEEFLAGNALIQEIDSMAQPDAPEQLVMRLPIDQQFDLHGSGLGPRLLASDC